jgi:hypothetical protein
MPSTVGNARESLRDDVSRTVPELLQEVPDFSFEELVVRALKFVF